MERVKIKNATINPNDVKDPDLKEYIKENTPLNATFAPLGYNDTKNLEGWHLMMFAIGKLYMTVYVYDDEESYNHDLEFLKKLSKN